MAETLQDFLGFSYGGWHSIHHAKIYRTADGSRYNINLIPTLTDKTADIPGGDGQFYFNSYHKNRQFTVNFAFEELTEAQLENLRSVFNGKDIKELVFDEYPYKAYDAKVTGNPSLKVVCFDDPKEGRIYKGEGTVQFTCYNPYAHTPTHVWDANFNYIEKDGRSIASYDPTVYTNRDEWNVTAGLTDYNLQLNRGNVPAPFVAEGVSGSATVGTYRLTDIEGVGNWDSNAGVVVDTNGTAIAYQGNARAVLKPGETAPANVKFMYWYY